MVRFSFSLETFILKHMLKKFSQSLGGLGTVSTLTPHDQESVNATNDQRGEVVSSLTGARRHDTPDTSASVDAVSQSRAPHSPQEVTAASKQGDMK